MNISKIILASSLGLAAGTLTGILSAPRSGKRTRKFISDEVKAKMTKLEYETEKKMGELKQTYNEKLDAFTTQGKSFLDKTHEKVSLN